MRQSGENRRVAGPVDIPAGTVMLFYQETVPTGWTRVTTSAIDKHALVVDTQTALGSFTGTKGGANDFTTALNGTVASGAHAGTFADHTHLTLGNGAQLYRGSGSDANLTLGGTGNNSLTEVTGSVVSGSGGTHTHTIDVDIAYINLFLASKD